jgi:chitin disaccharide deacetylase
MPDKKYLIVNADDFGQSPGVNQGIIKGYEEGIVTSTSLMVRWPAAAAAAAYALAHPALSVGLHLDLSEWAYRDGAWAPLYEVVALDDAAAVAAEVSRQLAAFRRLAGREPTHIDSHQHAHKEEPVRSILAGVARELRVPLRHFSDEIRYYGGFYGQMDQGLPYPEGITVTALIAILASLPSGITELGCHPAEGNDLDTMYGAERNVELKTLCDPRVRAALLADDMQLLSFLSARVVSGEWLGPTTHDSALTD